jgi:thiol:disulfide interchange protein
MIRLAGVVSGLALCAAIAASSPIPGDKKEESQVKFTATATPIKDGKQTVTIKMTINSGYYAYANPVKNETLEPAQTVVKITSAQKLEDVKVNYPEKQSKTKTTGAESYQIYEGTVEITADVTRAAGDTGPLEATVKFSVCNVKGFCLPPETVKLKVEQK